MEIGRFRGTHRGSLCRWSMGIVAEDFVKRHAGTLRPGSLDRTHALSFFIPDGT